MEVVFMDTSYKMTRIVDAFTSLIWVDRYIGFGEFELRLPMTDESLVGIRLGWYASIKESDRYMVVEGIEITTSFENGNVVCITGRSLESILDRRIEIDDMSFNCTFPEVITRLVNENAINPKNENRRITRLTSVDTVSERLASINVEITLEAGEILYNVILDLCKTYNAGFRILPDTDTDGGMIFELYDGVDRSYNQNKIPWVVFSPQFENIKDTKLVTNIQNLRSTVIGRATTTIGADEGSEVIEVILGDEYVDLERREIYNKSNVRAETTINKDSFGTAESMVNIRDYSTYEPVYFDREAYNAAMKTYNDTLSNLYVPPKKESTTQQWNWYKPGDDGYDSKYADYINVPGVNGYWTSVTVPGDTVEQHKANNSRYYAYAENNKPSQSSFMQYAWVLTDEVGYRAALAEAQAKIDAAYSAALEDSRNNVRASVKTENESVLAPYLKISDFDGEVDSNVQFKYGESYYLGDIVQIVNEFNYQAVTRVVSITFTEESGVGIIIYPGFASDDRAVFSL